ncbi:reverse transcriptase domain-containing protein, partial [Tanacetum coccineum]
ALTWWNSHKRTIGTEASFFMSWRELMKLMTEVYCPRNEIQKMETELWNLIVKNNDLTAYTQMFQELTMMCTKMVPGEEDWVEKFIGGLPDNIQENVIAAKPTRLQDAVRIANNLMDQKLKGYANTGGQNVARAYMTGNNEKNGYEGTLPFCIIMESLVKKKQKGAILELKQRHLKNTIFCTYTPYPAMKIRRISASSAQETRNDQFSIWRIHYNQYAVCTAVHQSKIHI